MNCFCWMAGLRGGGKDQIQEIFLVVLVRLCVRESKITLGFPAGKHRVILHCPGEGVWDKIPVVMSNVEHVPFEAP